MTIGERIVSLRKKLNITQTQLAEKADISKQNLYKYEKGIISNIPCDKIEKIADVLGCSPAYLMGWKDDVDKEIYQLSLDVNDILKKHGDCTADTLKEIEKRLKEFLLIE